MMTYELTFTTPAEAADFFSALDYRRIPAAGEIRAAHGRNDSGLAIITFARRLYGNDIRYTFTEQPKR